MNLNSILRRAFPKPPKGVSLFVNYKNARLTLKRLLNLHVMAAEYRSGATKLRSLPPKLVIEATNVCNLGCPGCFTGVGENGRVRSAISLESFQRVMDELGDTLFELEFYNWGEPFLNKSIFDMISDAHARGVGTTISTNFSVPFDAEKAEALVRSGLDGLGVSIDGATQETYEQYRVGGDLELVLRNCALVVEAKRRLGSATPQMVWIFHVFKHNVDDVPVVKKMGKQIGFDSVSVSRGWSEDDWEPPEKHSKTFFRMTPGDPCPFLWQYAVIHNEGGVAPCCASFYQEDDFGRLSLRPESPGVDAFREVWNSKTFQSSRSMFRKGARPHGDTICEQCPVTQSYHDFQDHLDSGKSGAEFTSRFGQDAGHRYFFRRRPTTRDTTKAVKPIRVRAKTSAAEAKSQ